MGDPSVDQITVSRMRRRLRNPEAGRTTRRRTGSLRLLSVSCGFETEPHLAPTAETSDRGPLTERAGMRDVLLKRLGHPARFDLILPTPRDLVLQHSRDCPVPRPALSDDVE